MRRKLPPKDPDRRHSARIADFINAIGQTRKYFSILSMSASIPNPEIPVRQRPLKCHHLALRPFHPPVTSCAGGRRV
jgi:hypothetical protein